MRDHVVEWAICIDPAIVHMDVVIHTELASINKPM